MLADLQLEVQKLIAVVAEFHEKGKGCCQRSRLKRAYTRTKRAVAQEKENKNTNYSEDGLLRLEQLLDEVAAEFEL